MEFTALEWTFDSNIYEVNLRQYSAEGNFTAFGRSLPRLRDMGVEILWFMPITPISHEKRLGSLGSYYACSDYTATNPEFGSIQDFRQLVTEAHALGFKVIIDWVANHTGWDHRWTREHPEYYKHDNHGAFYDSNGWEDVIDLNFDNPALRQALIDSMLFWVKECDIDGFRCDMAMLVPLDFWRQARQVLDAHKKLFWLAECEEASYHEVFDASYAWKFLHTMESYWRREIGIDGLYNVLGEYQDHFPTTAFRAFFTTNYDENSHSGSEYERMGAAAQALAVLCCTWNGLPLIYSGQELPNKRRLRFFDKDPIIWTYPCLLHDFYKSLLMLRKRNKALRAGDTSVKTIKLTGTGSGSNFAFLRQAESDQVLVLLNLSGQEDILLIEEAEIGGRFRNIFNGQEFNFSGNHSVYLQEWGFAVFEKLS